LADVVGAHVMAGAAVVEVGAAVAVVTVGAGAAECLVEPPLEHPATRTLAAAKLSNLFTTMTVRKPGFTDGWPKVYARQTRSGMARAVP
jgi:hypothetical protein